MSGPPTGPTSEPMTGRGTARIVLPGVAMIAVSFGLARYGYGPLLPDMQHELGLDARQSGLVASGAYLSYLVANLGVVWLTTRFGPRLPLAAAGAAAAAGMVLISLAGGPLGLAVGVLVAGASAGLAFPPYADLVASRVTRGRRAMSWSAISSGTGWGVALAGPLAITFGARWRLVWLVFAALATVVALVAVLSAPAGRGRGAERAPQLRLSWVFCPRSGPLLGVRLRPRPARGRGRHRARRPARPTSNHPEIAFWTPSSPSPDRVMPPRRSVDRSANRHPLPESVAVAVRDRSERKVGTGHGGQGLRPRGWDQGRRGGRQG